MDNIERRDMELVYISDDEVFEEQKIARRLTQELNTAGHSVHPATRNTLYEYGIDVTIGNNVWMGGCPL